MTQQYYKIQNEPSLLRDENSGAIVTTDKQGLAAYKAARAVKFERLKQQDKLAERQDKLENELTEIKSLLLELVGRK